MVKLFEKDLGKLQKGDFALSKIKSLSNEEFEGRLMYIGNQIDLGSRTVSGRIVSENKNNMAKIGLFGTAELYTSDYNVLAVPIDAIAPMQGKRLCVCGRKARRIQSKRSKVRKKIRTIVKSSGLTTRANTLWIKVYLLLNLNFKNHFRRVHEIS